MPENRFNLAVSIHNLSVERGGALVLAGLSCDLLPGDIVILRGDNGAGKTTVLRAIAGLARIAEGDIEVSADGEPQDIDDVRAESMHFLGDEAGVIERFSVAENLAYWHAALGMGSGNSADEILAQVQLQQMNTRRAGQMSAGQKKRLALARLIMLPRAIWIMDEPSNSLDAAGQALLQTACENHAHAGGIVIMAAHKGFAVANAKTIELLAGVQ